MAMVMRSFAAAALLAFETLVCVVSMLVLLLLAAAPVYVHQLPFQPEPWQWAATFTAACVAAIVASWVKGIFDKRLPSRIGGAPHHAHISGWTFIWIVIVTAVIVWLAQWAATSDVHKEIIGEDWGITILIGLGFAFLLAAIIPMFNLAERTSGIVKLLSILVTPFGRILSFFDSILVFAVAGAAGATQLSPLNRYTILFGTIAACTIMGYWLAPPWGLVPLAWGFIIAISISRRWSWVEEDRELAMLNRRFIGSHLRVGFGQDLRDEALLSFSSLLILIPLALRQAQLTAIDNGIELFALDPARSQELRVWVAFFGTELAKAVPFVDWAEVYNVGGSDDTIIHSVPSQHLVFAIRTLVDLVFLAALLQALAISARNATQRGLFYEQSLDRLDPFLEPREFRKLLRRVRGRWEPDPEKVAAFPPYDPIRLSELAGHERNANVLKVVNALRVKQGGSNIAEFHEELLKRIHEPNSDKAAIMEVLSAIRTVGPERKTAELDQARRELNGVPRMAEVRTMIIKLIGEASDSPEKTRALMGALDRDFDNLLPVRVTALAALGDAAARRDQGALQSLTEATKLRRLTSGERNDAKALLKWLNANRARLASLGSAPLPRAAMPTQVVARLVRPANEAADIQTADPSMSAVTAEGGVEGVVATAARPGVQRAPSHDPTKKPQRNLISAPLVGAAVVAAALGAYFYWQQSHPQPAAPSAVAAPETSTPTTSP